MGPEEEGRAVLLVALSQRNLPIRPSNAGAKSTFEPSMWKAIVRGVNQPVPSREFAARVEGKPLSELP
jgi:hypothetical protein